MSIAISFIFIGLSVVLIINSAKSITNAYHRMLLLRQAKTEVGDLRLRNLKLIEEREEILGEEYVEEEARDRLYYVKEGEVIVVLPQTAEEENFENKEEVKGVEEVRDPKPTVREEWVEVLKNGI